MEKTENSEFVGTYSVLNKSAFLDRMGKLNRRARKLNLPEAKAEITGTSDHEIIRNGFPLRYKLYHFTVTHANTNIEGYDFAGYSEWMTVEGKPFTITHSLPGFEGQIPEKYKHDNDGHCDHCGSVRRRQRTYLLKSKVNVGNGMFKQVGRNCLADFLGGHSSKRISERFDFAAWMLDTLESPLEDDDCGWSNGGFPPDAEVKVISLLSLSLAWIRNYGYISRKYVMDNPGCNKETTSSYMYDILKNQYRFDPKIHNVNTWKPIPEITDEDRAKAQEIIDWLASSTDSTEYMTNLRTFAQTGWCEYHHIGLMISAPVSYERHLGNLKEKAARPVSNYFGEVGKRYTMELTVVKRTPIDGQYGTTMLYLFNDASGNFYKWFCSGSTDSIDTRTLREADVVSLIGTVKAHEEYKGSKQTSLTRCKVLSFLN